MHLTELNVLESEDYPEKAEYGPFYDMKPFDAAQWEPKSAADLLKGAGQQGRLLRLWAEDRLHFLEAAKADANADLAGMKSALRSLEAELSDFKRRGDVLPEDIALLLDRLGVIKMRASQRFPDEISSRQSRSRIYS